MPNPEKVYQSPALTEGWDRLEDGDFYLFDTVNDYAKKYHLDKKNAPVGWDEEAYTVEEDSVFQHELDEWKSQNAFDPEFASNLGRGLGAPAVPHRRCPRNDLQRADPREFRRQRLMHPVHEIGLG